MGEVRLVDLEIIKRYSLAVRQETAPAEDVLAILDESRAVVAAAIEVDGAMKTKPPRARRAAKKATPR